MEALYHGYMEASKDNPDRNMDQVSMEDITTMNIFGDLEDLEQVFDSSYNKVKTGLSDQVEVIHHCQEPGKVRGLGGRCSALVRVLPDNSDMFVSHDTWNSYQSMLRILKKYKMPLRRSQKGESVPGVEMSFSGYPGVIYSGDDFTVTSSGLTILETTIGNSNADLWKYVKAQGSVLEGVRSTVANR